MMPPPQGQPPYGQGFPTQMVAPPKKDFNVLVVPLVISVLFLLGAIGFGVWAYMERQDYKNNSDQKAAAAAEVAKQQAESAKETEFIEREKEPLKEYNGPSSYGSLKILYPKTWSAFITETNSGPVPLDGYLHPNFVPGVQSGTSFALRVQVVNKKYDQEMKQFESKVKAGKVKAEPYQAPKVKTEETLGSRITGEIDQGKQSVMVLIPLRDKTLKISTESPQFIGDFDKIIMENLTFSP